MTDLLLREFTNSDIDWLLDASQSTRIEAKTPFLQSLSTAGHLYILIEGTLSAGFSQNPDRLPTRGSRTMTYPAIDVEIARLTSGELLGAIPLVETALPNLMVQAMTTSFVLEVPRSRLIEKLETDISFAAHFYRISALLLCKQLDHLMHRLGHRHSIFIHPKEAVTVFAALQDQDLDWLIAAGKVETIAAKSLITKHGKPIDDLHIILDGAIALTVPEDDYSRVSHAFTEKSVSQEREVARLSRGDMIGEMLLVNATFPAIALKALRNSQILSIPRWRFAAKLLHDVGFAARFYRVLATLLANQQRAIAQQLGYDSASDSQTDSHQVLTQVALSEARFEWLLKRIQTQAETERKIQW